MTVVNPETGELVEPLSEADAERLTERIRLTCGAVADNIDRLSELVLEAQTGRAHIALGYRSWTEYVEHEFAGFLPRLDREPRRELVATLAETGMSTRAIGPVVGVSKSQVASDLDGVSTSGQTRTIHGRDGIDRTYERPHVVPPLPPESAEQRKERELEHGRKTTVQGIAERVYALAKYFDPDTFLRAFHPHEAKYVAEPIRLTRPLVREAIENLTELEKGLPS